MISFLQMGKMLNSFPYFLSARCIHVKYPDPSAKKSSIHNNQKRELAPKNVSVSKLSLMTLGRWQEEIDGLVFGGSLMVRQTVTEMLLGASRSLRRAPI